MPITAYVTGETQNPHFNQNGMETGARGQCWLAPLADDYKGKLNIYEV